MGKKVNTFLYFYKYYRMDNTNKRYRLYPLKSCVIAWGPTKWVPITYPHPLDNDKTIDSFYLVHSPETPKRLFWKD